MLRTHYDRLKIARDAPIEVVRAAYRALSLKYHPDRNPGDSEAARSMALLNAAYAVLSDPEQRRQHDAWIRSVESPSHERPGGASNALSYPAAVAPASIHARDDAHPVWVLAHRHRYALGGGIGLLVVLAGLAGSAVYREAHVAHPVGPLPVVPAETITPRQSAALEARQLWPAPASSPSPGERSASPPKAAMSSSGAGEPTSSPNAAVPANRGGPATVPDRNSASSGGLPPNPHPKPSASAPHTAEPSVPTRTVHYDDLQPRPDTAPNGERWPATSDYIRGYELLYTDGGSQLVIDNSHNNFDVFLKLVSVTDPAPKTVRSVFIVAHGQFTARNIRSGTYEVRYHQLGSGTLLRSSTFALEESAIAGGTRYSMVTLALKAAADESANAYPITAAEFEQ